MSEEFGLQSLFLFVTLLAVAIGLAAHHSLCLFVFVAILLAPLPLIRGYAELSQAGAVLFVFWILMIAAAIAFFTVCLPGAGLR